MQFQDNPFGSLPQFGQPQQGMAGPGGFAGGMPQFGGFGAGMFGAPPEDEEKKKRGMNPLMMLSPLAAAFGSGHPNIGLGMISPAFGIARALGAFK